MTKKKKVHGRPKHQADPEGYVSNSSDEENNSQSNKCCPHVTKAVNLGAIKKAFKGKLQFGVCQNCLKKDAKESEEFCESVWMCLQCGHQGCGRLSNARHSLEHYETPHSDNHSVVANTSLWSIWCYQCDDEVDVDSSKRLAECVDFIKKHVENQSELTKEKTKPKISLKEARDDSIENVPKDAPVKKEPIASKLNDDTMKVSEHKKINGLVYDQNHTQVRGLINLTNTCFFNAVLQNLSQIPCFIAALEENCSINDREWKIETPTELKLENDEEFISLSLPPSENVTLTLMNLLKEMNSSPQQKRSATINPKPLFSLIVQRYSQFRGYSQQDSHEFLRCLLDCVRTEEIKRHKKSILKLFNLTEKTRPDQVEKDVKTKVKALGKYATQTFVDKVFGGQIVSTVLCEQCQMTSQVFESFMDLSLPVNEEKPTRPGLHRKSFSEDTCSREEKICPRGPSKYQEKKIKRQTKKEMKKQAKLEKKSAKIVSLNGSSESVFKSEGNEDDGSEADVNDADIEDNEDDNTSQDTGVTVPTSGASTKNDNECQNTSESTSTNDSIVADSDTSLSRTLSSSEVTIVGSDGDNGNKENEINAICQAVSELVVGGNKSESKDSLIESPEDATLGSPGVTYKDGYLGSTDSGLGNLEKAEEEEQKLLKQEWKQKSWTSMRPRPPIASHECSIHSCLNLFTHPEFLMGKNKFGCDNCTKLKAEQAGIDKNKQAMVYTNAIKQLHIFNPPAVLTLHLKRFQQSGMSLTKVNQFVEFPLILDLAPFCSSIALGLPHLKMGQNKILYSLCGVVHHSGTLNGGHYTAYVKKQNCKDPPNLSFLNDKALSQCDVDNLLEEFMKKKDSDKGTAKVEPSENYSLPEISSKWYHVSDTQVSQVSESAVLRCRAYLLFYERIL